MAYGLVKRPYGMVRDVGAVVMMPILSRQHASGTPADVRASDAVREAYLGAGRREELFTR